MITLHLLALALAWGLCAAIVGVAWVQVIGDDDTPLNAYFKWLFDWQARGGWRSWITSPLGGCHKCFSGQLALWTSSVVIPWAWSAESLTVHIVAACSAILSASLIGTIIKWMDNKM